jgi:hypothetical protein
MAGHRSFVKHLLYPFTFSILYGWEINKLSCRYKYFTPSTMWFVVRRRRKGNPPPLTHSSVIRHNVTYSTTQCALIVQKYAQTVRHFMWNFRLICSSAITLCIIRIWRLIFVLQRSNSRFGKRIKVCIICDTLLSKEWSVYI